MNNQIDGVFLREQAAIHNILLSDEMVEQFSIYARMLIEWNERVNLTAITEPKEIVVKHFIDSLTLLPLLPQKQFTLIDVGTGAGFPGVPLAIVNNKIKLTLLDSLNKRLLFLKECCETLTIPVTLIHARAEEVGGNTEMREKYDAVTARAVAAMPVLCEYCLPLVKVGGRFIAMKGPDGEEEAIEAKRAITALGGKLTMIEKTQLNIGDEVMERRLLCIDKISSTPSKFPRSSAKIKKGSL